MMNKRLKPMDELKMILDTQFRDRQLLGFIKNNINDKDINKLVYKVSLPNRIPFVKYVEEGTAMYGNESRRFLIEFLDNYLKTTAKYR